MLVVDRLKPEEVYPYFPFKSVWQKLCDYASQVFHIEFKVSALDSVSSRAANEISPSYPLENAILAQEMCRAL